MSEAYSVTQSCAPADRDAVIGLLERAFPGADHRHRHMKYYDRNPCGPPLVFEIRETASQALVGLNAVFPLRLWVRGETIRAGISADFVVDAPHRGRGLSHLLQRTKQAALADAGLECTFSWPNALGLVHSRSTPTSHEVAPVVRYVKVLRFWGLASRRARTRTGLRRVLRGFATEKPGAFDHRFDAVWDAMRARHTVAAARSAEILNWKYDDAHTIFALATASGEVAAYLVYANADGTREILDAGWGADESAAEALLAGFVLDAREHGDRAVSCTLAGRGGELAPPLRALGFTRRPSSTSLFLTVASGAPHAGVLLAAGSWYLLGGDNDV